MRAVVLALMIVAPARALAARHAGCVVHGEDAPLSFEVRPDDGPPFVTSFGRSEFTVHADVPSGEYLVDVASPLRFHGFVRAPFPAAELTRATAIGDGTVTLQRGTRAALVGTRGAEASIAVDLDGVLALRADVPCDALKFGTADGASTRGKARHWRPRGSSLHLFSRTSAAAAFVLTVKDRERADFFVTRRRGAFVFVDTAIGRARIRGWVPAHELKRLGHDDDEGVIGHISGGVIGCMAAPVQSHPARIAAGAPIYPAPDRHPWARAAHELPVWISDAKGPWVEVRSLCDHVWVRRSSVLEDGDRGSALDR